MKFTANAFFTMVFASIYFRMDGFACSQDSSLTKLDLKCSRCSIARGGHEPGLHTESARDSFLHGHEPGDGSDLNTLSCPTYPMFIEAFGGVIGVSQVCLVLTAPVSYTHLRAHETEADL
eukprot:3530439-Amphidinium_carterae.1